ncbi:hypothetical protein EBT31_06345 [bacterium]|nr:hypothetical protein [bacterium]
MDQLRDPVMAALFAAVATAAYIYFKARVNNESVPSNSVFMKPAILNAILVYFIVSNGSGTKPRILTEPF